MKRLITYCFAFSACIVVLLFATKNDPANKKTSPCKMEKQSNPVSIDQSSNNFFTVTSVRLREVTLPLKTFIARPVEII